MAVVKTKHADEKLGDKIAWAHQYFNAQLKGDIIHSYKNREILRGMFNV